ncbi:MAG: hypothetical protein A2252_00440 [Elusimicrobia bacterium RIFOXYA2_FULL_39_19]|nr:MAG: hypothetical protein A2252_00440 [Elusimicrobia bacterium RIFOXYA2_FULL_39_19]
MVITLKKIAEELNVSAMTVSRALNDKAWVESKLKEKIQKKAAQLGYKPNHIARSLVSSKSNTIGLIIPQFEISFFPEICIGVEKPCSERNYEIYICCSYGKAKREAEEINSLLSRKIDGLIIVPSQDEHDISVYRELLKNKIPFVLVDRYFSHINCSYVVSDDKTGAYNAVSYLIDLGHRKIAHISGPKFASTTQSRIAGYRNALKSKTIDSELILEGSFDEKSGYETMKKILKEKYTAVFAANDFTAFGALQAIEEAGMKVPDDISIIGFDDSHFSKYLKVSLTTVRQNPVEIGKTAVEILFENIQNPAKYRRAIIPTELVIRQSCGKL